MSPFYYQRGPDPTRRSPFPPLTPFDRISRLFDGLPPVVAWLLKLNIALYLIFKLGALFHSVALDASYQLLSLSLAGIRRHFYWQPVTYLFLHGGFFHLLLNMLTLLFLGPETERSMGSRHFLAMYLLSGIIGGLGWLWITASTGINAYCVGASGAIFGVLAAFATLYPHRRLTIFVFIFPITTEAWKAMLGIGVLEFFLIPSGGPIANAAHFFGALAGFLYVDRLYESALVRRSLAWLRDYFRSRPHTPYNPPSSGGSAPPSQEEVDRILDKISQQGIQSLTREERQTLHRASSTF